MGPGAIKGILYGVMFLSLGVLLVLFKKQDNIGKGRTAVAGLILSAFAIISAVVILKYDGWVAEKKRGRIAARERKYLQIGYERFGREIAMRYSGKKVLLIAQKPYEPFGEDLTQGEKRLPFTEIQLLALQKGMGSACNVVAVEKVRSEMDYEMMEAPPNAAPDEESIFSAKMVDSLMKKYKEVDAIVLLIGLPMDYKDMKIWQMKESEKRPAVILANSSPYGLKKAIRRGFVSLMLLSQSRRIDFDAPIPADEKEAFDERYILLTPDNLDEVADRHPKLF